MRSLLISLGISLFSFSCSPAVTKGMMKQDNAAGVAHNPYFSRADLDHVYKASITYKENGVSGLLIVKKINEAHRVVMTSEFGSRLMDLTLGPDGLKKNFVLEDLDRKAFLNLLQKDLKLMLTEEYAMGEQYSSEKDRVTMAKGGGDRQYLFFAQSDDHLHRLIRRSFGKDRVQVDIIQGEPDIASHILLQHLTKDLTIELHRVTP